MAKTTFNNKNNLFFSAINREVEEYFIRKGIKKSGNYRLYLKSFILITAAVGLYFSLLLINLPAWVAILFCAVLGFCIAAIGFNVMHDANHGSYSQKKWLNNMLGLTANCLGINAFIWKQKHNIIHHTYTNVEGIDDDISKMPVLRLCPSQKYLKLHKYQYLYCIPMYGLTTLLWTFGTDFSKYFSKSINNTPIRNMNRNEHIVFWLSKVLYIFFYIALPVYLVGLLPFILGFFIMHFIAGLTISIVFQLAHVVEITHFTDSADGDKIDTEWAVHQVKSTANFAIDNKALSWFTGGLNYQVEHHLFPKISHIHYPAISKIVMKYCDQFHVKYLNYKTMSSAIASHLRLMKLLGTPDFTYKPH